MRTFIRLLISLYVFASSLLLVPALASSAATDDAGLTSCASLSVSDASANLPGYSQDVVASVSTNVTSSDYLDRQAAQDQNVAASASERTARDNRPGDLPVAASNETAEIRIPVGVSAIPYAAHSDLLSLAPDCAEIQLPIAQAPGLAPYSCNRCAESAI